MVPKFITYFRDKILIPFRLVPKDGLTPGKLAFSVTIGIITGLFPVFGATTLLCLLLTLLFRQNLLVVQSVQWLMAVFQILLIIPFMRLGALLLKRPELHINLDQIKSAFEPGMIEGVQTLGMFHLYGILGWTVLAFPSAFISYFAFLAVFRKKNQAINLDIE
ncbi:MAG: DUF2062 domain-containing protein [Bacteroidales bacterium]|nr:DUF2062 domain-containing protein [Bacteroidales bacterium]